MKAYNKQQEEDALIKKYIASADTYANFFKQAKSKQKTIDKMEAAGLSINKLPPPIIAFTDVAFSYSDKKQDENLSFGIDMDSRIAILGANDNNLKLTKSTQHSADQQPYEKTPVEYFDTPYREKY